MALLTDRAHLRAGLQALSLVLLAVLTGCVLLQQLTATEPTFTFDHAAHVEAGLDCADCHSGVEDAEEPGIPALGQCLLCHAEIDADKPPERSVETLFDDAGFRRSHARRLTEESRFSHLGHVNAGLDCAACHPGVEASRSVAELEPPDMQACMACHAQRGIANECATCHTAIDTGWRPPGHELGWMKRHGQAFRAQGDAPAETCSLCHSQSNCTTCHQEVPPDSHSNYWRRRGHGVEARLDRETCATCHRSDFCSRCHQESQPVSHRGMWGAPRDAHCLTCHFPLSSEGCFTCHKSDPSHLEATPLPDEPPHSPGLNCRQCHGLNAPLPHADKGDECTLCHR